MRFYDDLLGHELNDASLELNKRGHRCNDIEDINLHNYILFAGDNVALDFNSPISETYPYLISKSLGMDYYNLAIFNGGIDAMKYNLLRWYYRYPKPKFIVISSEFLNSILVSEETGYNLRVADYNDDRVTQILVAGEKFGFLPSRHILAENTLLEHINVPIYQIVFSNKVPLFRRGVTTVEHSGDLFDHGEITKLIVREHQLTRSKILP